MSILDIRNNSYPTPDASTFHSSVKKPNYPYVYMGELNEQFYEQDIFDRFGRIERTGKKHLKSHYRTYDWKNDNLMVELKSRNNDAEVYGDTMIGWNKVEEYNKDTSNRRYYFLFAFLDGFYEWELTADNFEKLPDNCVRQATNDFSYGAEYTTFNENKDHLYIPLNQLTKISDKGCLVPNDLKNKSRRCMLKPGVCYIKF